mgnify:CR=1 FL=1
MAQTFRFLAHDGAPVLLDWLPWSHTFGGNHNMNIVLAHGGTMFIDDGRPLPGLVDRTIAHLREVQPTVYFNVPRGYEMLLPALETDAVLAMYHDQGLPVLKYSGFERAVNLTLGLPYPRVAVDHGTALELAGRGVADPSSLFAAIDTCKRLARLRATRDGTSA